MEVFKNAHTLTIVTAFNRLGRKLPQTGVPPLEVTLAGLEHSIIACKPGDPATLAGASLAVPLPPTVAAPPPPPEDDEFSPAPSAPVQAEPVPVEVVPCSVSEGKALRKAFYQALASAIENAVCTVTGTPATTVSGHGLAILAAVIGDLRRRNGIANAKFPLSLLEQAALEGLHGEAAHFSLLRLRVEFPDMVAPDSNEQEADEPTIPPSYLGAFDDLLASLGAVPEVTPEQI